MWEFENNIVRKAFKKHWGLQNALKTAIKNNDTLLLNGSLDSLKTYTGMQKEFLKNNINEIIEL